MPGPGDCTDWLELAAALPTVLQDRESLVQRFRRRPIVPPRGADDQLTRLMRH